MPEVVNTSALSFDTDISNESSNAQIEDDRPTAIKVENVSMIFNMASERLNNLKEYFLKLVKHQLFFEELVALDDISFEVKKGDVFGILGTNGSGKSTLLKIIAGVLEPSKGNVEINGAIAPLIELGAGFDMDLSARENIYLNGALLGYSKDFIEDHFDDIVEFAEIEKFLDMPMKNYSSGMVARIAFAIATVMVPEILIVDEVLSVGDFMFQQKCENRINELIEKHGVTVLIVSHSNDQIERLCNKAIWIEKGHTRIMGDSAKVCNAYKVLGGRTGSAKSEQIVFNALQNTYFNNEDLIPCRTIKGENCIDIACKLAMDEWGKSSSEYAILVPSFTHCFSLEVSGIAGKFNAPILPYTSEIIPENVLNTINYLNVKNVLIVCKYHEYDSFSTQITKTNHTANTALVPIDRNPENNIDGILGFEKELDSWNSDQVIAASFLDHAISFIVSPLIYAEKNTFLIIDANGRVELPKNINNNLKSLNPKSILAIGEIYNSKICNWFKNNGYNISKIEETPRYENINFEVLAHVANSPSFKDSKELIIATNINSKWQDMLTIASYAGKRRALLLLIDNTDLNDIAMTINFIKQSNLELLTFIGDGNLSEIDKKVLASK